MLAFSLAVIFLTYSGGSTVPRSTILGQRITRASFDGVIVDNSTRPQGTFWTPSEAQVLGLERALPAYVSATLRERNTNLPKRLSEYKRQYFGFVDQRRHRIIAVTFLHEATDAVTSGKWLHVLMTVSGGGDHFLGARYDADAKVFREFWINAPE
jgi:hypothetical protein